MRDPLSDEKKICPAIVEIYQKLKKLDLKTLVSYMKLPWRKEARRPLELHNILKIDAEGRLDDH